MNRPSPFAQSVADAALVLLLVGGVFGLIAAVLHFEKQTRPVQPCQEVTQPAQPTKGEKL